MDARALERYRWRLFNRLPLIGGWLRRGAARALARAGSTEAMRLLAQAVAVSPDAGLRRMAADILGRRDSQAAIDAVAVEWAQTRHPELEGLLCARGLPPSGPPGPRLLAALRLGQVETAARTGAEGVPSLIAACKDS